MNGTRPQRASLVFALGLGFVSVVGCGKILGFEDFTDARGGPGDGLPDATADGGQPAEAGNPDVATPGDAGDGGEAGGRGDGGGCTPSTTAPCSEDGQGQTIPGLPSPAQGICKLGTKTCSAGGTWGACVGAVGPAARDCDSANDNNCDGLPDNTLDAVCECNAAHPTRTISGGPKNCECTETCGAANKWVVCTPPTSCECTPLATRTCTGASGCAGGTQTCASDRTWGTCTGAPAKATYCQDHDGDGACAATVACATVCPGQLAAEWKVGCTTNDCDDTKSTVTPTAGPVCTPANVCKTGMLTCAPSGNTCTEKGNVSGGVCGTNSTCGGGTCNVCPAGSAICNGVCISVTGTDANNCGGCGLTCGGATCASGRCQPKTITTATADIRSIAVLNGIVFYTTSSAIYHCVDAACSSASGLSAANGVLRARNSLVYALADTNVFRYTSAGTVLSQASFPFNANYSWREMDVAPNGMLYAIQTYDLVRFDTSNLGAGANVATIISGSTDESVQLFSIAANDDVFTTLDGLGGATRRCLGTTCTDIAQDADYVHVVNQHLAYTTNAPSPLFYCSYDLITCTQIMTGVTSYVADDGKIIFVNANNNLVAVDPLNGNKQTVILTNLSAVMPSNLSVNQIAFDGDYIYWVGTGGRTVQRTRKY